VVKRAVVGCLLGVVVALFAFFALGTPPNVARNHDTAAARELQQYEQVAFTRQLESGGTLVVHVHADWCPACRKQAPIISELAHEPTLAGVTFVRVNYDTDKDFVLDYNVPFQSFILVYRDGHEVARMGGITEPEEIKRRVHKALS
jgi:thiol-disulfide isomerase/thioredoxin